MRMKLSLLVSSILILGMALSGCQNLNDQMIHPCTPLGQFLPRRWISPP